MEFETGLHLKCFNCGEYSYYNVACGEGCDTCGVSCDFKFGCGPNLRMLEALERMYGDEDRHLLDIIDNN